MALNPPRLDRLAILTIRPTESAPGLDREHLSGGTYSIRMAAARPSVGQPLDVRCPISSCDDVLHTLDLACDVLRPAQDRHDAALEDALLAWIRTLTRQQ